VRETPPFLFSSIRFFLAGSVLLVYSLWRGAKWPTGSEWRVLLIVSFLLLGIGNGVLTWAEQWVPAGIASLIIIATPFWLVLFARISGEAVSPKAVVGLIVGFAGLLFLLWPDLSSFGFRGGFAMGALGLCFSSAAWALGSVYAKNNKPVSDPIMVIALQKIMAAVYQGVFGLCIGEAARWSLPAASFWAILYLAVFGSIVGYTAYIYALDHFPTEQVSIYAYANPLVAVGLGVLFLGERMDLYMLMGVPLVLWGIYLVNTARARPVSRPGVPVSVPSSARS
jgi:drug/metabolite transporter (DMT)-like permease